MIVRKRLPTLRTLVENIVLRVHNDGGGDHHVPQRLDAKQETNAAKTTGKNETGNRPSQTRVRNMLRSHM
jgi:hypothetical protein